MCPFIVCSQDSCVFDHYNCCLNVKVLALWWSCSAGLKAAASVWQTRVCVCMCERATCNLVVWCGVSSRCQNKLVELQCAHPALPGPRRLSRTDGSNHLPRCLSPPALSSSLFLCNKINSLPGPLLPLLLFHIFCRFFLFCCWDQSFLLLSLNLLCFGDSLPHFCRCRPLRSVCLREYVGFLASIVGGSKIQRLLTKNMRMYDNRLALLRFCLSVSDTDRLTNKSQSQCL